VVLLNTLLWVKVFDFEKQVHDENTYDSVSVFEPLNLSDKENLDVELNQRVVVNFWVKEKPFVRPGTEDREKLPDRVIIFELLKACVAVNIEVFDNPLLPENDLDLEKLLLSSNV
jgi:hypothetical protein